MPLLNKNVLKNQVAKPVKQYIEEWDCDVYFKKFSIQDTILLEELNNKKRISEVEKVLNIIMLACVDQHGNKIFNVKDKEELLSMPVEVLYKLADIANEATGLNDQDIDEKAKNS